MAYSPFGRRSSRGVKNGQGRKRAGLRSRGAFFETLESRQVMAGIGDLDPTFGNGGFATTEFSTGEGPPDIGRDAVIQADGKTIVAGDRLIARYLPNGELDLEFGDNGKVVFPNFSFFSQPFTGVGLQADGKIIVARTAQIDSPSLDFVVTRYNTDGTIDNSFGVGGRTVTDLLGSSDDRVTGLVIQPDGKIVVGGAVLAGGGNANKFAVVRYTADGALDTSFNGNGKQLEVDGAALDIALGADGKIVLVGQRTNANVDIAVVRYLTNGTVDTSFDGDGVAVTDFTSLDSAEGVAIQADGKIVVTGYGGFYNVMVLRYLETGGLDSTFSGDGILNPSIGGFSRGYSVAIQADGDIVVAGESFTFGTPPSSNAVVLRLLSNGDFDTSFGGDGVVTTNFNSAALSVELLSDGRILTVGGTLLITTSDIFLTRYLNNGDLDTSFSDDGFVAATFEVSTDFARDAVLQPDGKIILAGHSDRGRRQVSVARYLPDGSLDPTFSNNGKVNTAFGQSPYITSVALQPDGKIVVAGLDLASGAQHFLVLRYLADGTLDPTFDGDGIVTTDVPGVGDVTTRVVVQSDGKIVVAGSSDSADSDIVIVRYLDDGSLDTTFDGDGIAVASFGGEEVFADLAIQADGKIVIGGSKDGDLLVVRYLSNGSLDTSFDGDGFTTTDLGAGVYPFALAVQPDGKLLLTGGFGIGLGSDSAVVARYLDDGTLDPTFDGDGLLTLAIQGTQIQITSVAAQEDGKILLAGNTYSWNSSAPQDFLVYRLNADGSPDSWFGSDGQTTFRHSDPERSFGQKLLIDAEGNYFVAGYATNQEGSSDNVDFTLAKLIGDGALVFEAEGELAHQIGHAEGGGWVAKTATDAAGYLSYGPYTTAVPLGLQTAIFRLQYSSDAAPKTPVVTIDVYDYQAGRTLAKRVLLREDFGATNFWHEFKLDFDNLNPNAVLEFRTFWHDTVDVKLDGVQIVPSDLPQFQAETDFGHLVGHADGDGWVASTAADAASYLAYGPYTSEIDPGFYTALYRLKSNGGVAPAAAIVTIDVWDFNAGKLVAQRTLHGSDFPVKTYLDFTLDFEFTNPNAVLEFRTFWHDTADVKLDLVRVLPREAPLHFEAETQLSHRVGHADGDGWAATSATESAGYLSLGPYTQQVEQGFNTAIFRLQTHGAAATAPVVTIDVWDHQSKQILAQRTLLGADFAAADTYQDFALDFVNTNPNAFMEFHTYWHDTADVKLDYVRVYARQVANYEAETQLAHQVGQAETDGWKATSATASAAYLAYGPYTDDIDPGQYTALYRLKSSFELLTAPIVTIDVWDANAGRSIAQRTLRSTDFNGADYQEFALDFEVTNPNARLEFRTFWHDNSDVKLDRVRVLDEIFAGDGI